ncbi:hypothetical protein LX36DRAFT_193678 [Colletotrichum falcatum]|nr:hypothetical protein LX36DRAFT_193678 [Colletotrichum falcatum]
MGSRGNVRRWAEVTPGELGLCAPSACRYTLTSNRNAHQATPRTPLVFLSVIPPGGARLMVNENPPYGATRCLCVYTTSRIGAAHQCSERKTRSTSKVPPQHYRDCLEFVGVDRGFPACSFAITSLALRPRVSAWDLASLPHSGNPTEKLHGCNPPVHGHLWVMFRRNRHPGSVSSPDRFCHQHARGHL